METKHNVELQTQSIQEKEHEKEKTNAKKLYVHTGHIGYELTIDWSYIRPDGVIDCLYGKEFRVALEKKIDKENTHRAVIPEPLSNQVIHVGNIGLPTQTPKTLDLKTLRAQKIKEYKARHFGNTVLSESSGSLAPDLGIRHNPRYARGTACLPDTDLEVYLINDLDALEKNPPRLGETELWCNGAVINCKCEREALPNKKAEIITETAPDSMALMIEYLGFNGFAKLAETCKSAATLCKSNMQYWRKIIKDYDELYFLYPFMQTIGTDSVYDELVRRWAKIFARQSIYIRDQDAFKEMQNDIARNGDQEKRLTLLNTARTNFINKKHPCTLCQKPVDYEMHYTDPLTKCVGGVFMACAECLKHKTWTTTEAMLLWGFNGVQLGCNEEELQDGEGSRDLNIPYWRRSTSKVLCTEDLLFYRLREPLLREEELDYRMEKSVIESKGNIIISITNIVDRKIANRYQDLPEEVREFVSITTEKISKDPALCEGSPETSIEQKEKRELDNIKYKVHIKSEKHVATQRLLKALKSDELSKKKDPVESSESTEPGKSRKPGEPIIAEKKVQQKDLTSNTQFSDFPSSQLYSEKEVKHKTESLERLKKTIESMDLYDWKTSDIKRFAPLFLLTLNLLVKLQKLHQQGIVHGNLQFYPVIGEDDAELNRLFNTISDYKMAVAPENLEGLIYKITTELPKDLDSEGSMSTIINEQTEGRDILDLSKYQFSLASDMFQLGLSLIEFLTHGSWRDNWKNIDQDKSLKASEEVCYNHNFSCAKDQISMDSTKTKTTVLQKLKKWLNQYTQSEQNNFPAIKIKFPAWCPRAFRLLILKCIQQNPSKRPKIDDLIQMLQAQRSVMRIFYTESLVKKDEILHNRIPRGHHGNHNLAVIGVPRQIMPNLIDLFIKDDWKSLIENPMSPIRRRPERYYFSLGQFTHGPIFQAYKRAGCDMLMSMIITQIKPSLSIEIHSVFPVLQAKNRKYLVKVEEISLWDHLLEATIFVRLNHSSEYKPSTPSNQKLPLFL